MAGIRYDIRGFGKKFQDGPYREQLQDRNIKQVLHYESPDIGYPTNAEMSSLTLSRHIWNTGDRFYKLAANAYGDSKYWWIIPWFNRRPLEADYKPGDAIAIPGPLGQLLSIYGRGSESRY